MINYPNGQTYTKQLVKKKTKNRTLLNAANRGMNLEQAINESNDFYLQHNICLVTKRPTPINIVKVDYSKGCKIVDAYFEKQSTTDYNGVYKGRYLDFEAKNTLNNTSFPLSNISPHQIAHLSNVISHNGIAFFIIQFQSKNEIYLLDAKYVINFYNNEKRKSIPYKTFVEEGMLLKQGVAPRINYIDAIDNKYFKTM